MSRILSFLPITIISYSLSFQLNFYSLFRDQASVAMKKKIKRILEHTLFFLFIGIKRY